MVFAVEVLGEDPLEHVRPARAVALEERAPGAEGLAPEHRVDAVEHDELHVAPRGGGEPADELERVGFQRLGIPGRARHHAEVEIARSTGAALRRRAEQDGGGYA